MPNTTQSISLESILTTTHDKMQQLLIILKNEASVLEKNKLEEFDIITQKKIALTEQIEKNEQLRIHFLKNKSLNPNEPSQWLQSNKLNSLWSEIKKTSEQAQKQNQINGLVINGNRRRVQTKIEILSSTPIATELTYSASGENIKQRNSSILTHA